MKILDQDIKKTLKRRQAKALEARREPCPDEELLGLYTEGSLTGPEKDRVLEHLSLCPDCLEVVLMVTSCDTEQALGKVLPPIRAELVKKVKGLIEPGADKILFDLVVRSLRKGLEVIHTSMTPLPPLYQPAAAALRGNVEANLPEPIRMEKSFDNTVAEVEISTAGEDVWNVQVLLKRADRQGPQEGLRVTLKDNRPKKVIQSLAVRNGVASFAKLPGGEYALEIRAKGAVVGELTVCLSRA